LVNQLYPAEWMAETLFHTVDIDGIGQNWEDSNSGCKSDFRTSHGCSQHVSLSERTFQLGRLRHRVGARGGVLILLVILDGHVEEVVRHATAQCGNSDSSRQTELMPKTFV